MVYESPREKLRKKFGVPYDEPPPGVPPESIPSGGGGSSGGGGGRPSGQPSRQQPTPVAPTPFTPRAMMDIMQSRIPYAQKLQQIHKLREQQRQFKQPMSMTQQQYFQETEVVRRDVSKQVREYGLMMEGIDPQESYKYQGSTMTGATLKTKLESEYGKPLREAEQQSQLAWQQARDIPKDAKVTKTDEGYRFDFRDTSLDWSKGEFKKIEKAPPGVRQVAEFGFGAVSSFGALIKPIALDPLIGTPKSRASHFVSPLDVVFEPVGWSPKGSTELMAKHPIFTAGGVGAEVVQSYAFTQLLKPVSKGVKIGAKGLVKRVPSVYGKFSKVFPEEKFISGIGGKLATKEIPKTVYRWGAKGYKKGFELTSAGVKTTGKTQAGKTGSIIRSVTQKTKFGHGGVKRVWLSPSEYVKAEKDIAAKLALKKTVEKGYQARIRGGIGEASELIERTKFKLSWTGKRLVKSYKTTRQTWKVGKEISPLYKTHKVGTKGSITRFALEGADEPILSSGWYGKVKGMYTHGYSRTVPTETGHVISTMKGFGTPGTTPITKKWITKYRPPFLKNIQAQTSITLQQLKHKTASKIRFVGGRADVAEKLTRVTVPSSIYKPVYEIGLELGSLGILKTLTRTKQKQRLKPELVVLQRTEHKSALKKIQVPMLDTLQTPGMKKVQRVVFKSVFDTVNIPQLVQKRVTKVDVPVPRTTRPYFSMIGKPGFGLPWFPKRDLFGRGSMMSGSGRVGKRYRFREFDVGDLFTGVKI